MLLLFSRQKKEYTILLLLFSCHLTVVYVVDWLFNGAVIIHVISACKFAQRDETMRHGWASYTSSILFHTDFWSTRLSCSYTSRSLKRIMIRLYCHNKSEHLPLRSISFFLLHTSRSSLFFASLTFNCPPTRGLVASYNQDCLSF